MNRPADILKLTSHRPWPLPKGPWQYYQEWNNALFLHWKVPAETIQSLVPAGLEVDVMDGMTWVSLVAFTMEKIRPKYLPTVPAISDFHEINLRAYVSKDNKPGVYFLNIEAQKLISVLLAKGLSGLPYEKATIEKVQQGNSVSYTSVNTRKKFHLETTYQVLANAYTKTETDKWLTERYCLYLDQGPKLYRYEIQHEEWNVKSVKLEKLDLIYQKGLLQIKNRPPDLVHFSEGVKVLAWPRQQV